MSRSVNDPSYAKKRCRSTPRKKGDRGNKGMVVGNLCLAADMTGSDALKDVTGVILAGGVSERMGSNKALLEVGGMTLLERIYQVMTSLFKEVLLVTNEVEKYTFLPCRKVKDSFTGRGVLAGLHAGLRASLTDRICVVPCAAPFLSPDLLTLLCQVDMDHDVIVPVTATGTKPLPAVYAKSCLPALDDLLVSSVDDFEHFLRTVKCRYLMPAEYGQIVDAELSFCHLDFPEEYAALTQGRGAEEGCLADHDC